MGYLEIAGPLNVHNPSHAAERERGKRYRAEIAWCGSFLTQPKESKKRKQREFRGEKEGRQQGEVTGRRRIIEEQRMVPGDECGEVKSAGAEKKIRQKAG